MFYLEIILAWGAATLLLVIGTYNIFKKLRTAANSVLAALSLLTSVLAGMIGTNLLDPGIIPAGLMHRIILALLLLAATLFMSFFFIYPYPKKNRPVLALAASLPGYVLSAIIIATDTVLSRSADDPAASALGEGYPVYLAVITGYLIVSILVIVIKSGRNENRAQKNDLVYLIISLGILFSSFLAVSLYLPYFHGFNHLSTLGILITYPFALAILNYAAIDIQTKDLRVFFATAFYWVILLTLLCVPVTLVLKFNTGEYLQEPVPPLGIALIVFLYLFLVFKYLSPRIEKLPTRGHRSKVARVDELFSEQLSPEAREGKSWEDLLMALVDGLVKKFDISHAHFYLYNSRDKKLAVIHNSVNAVPDTEMAMNSPLVEALGRNPVILYKPAVYWGAEFSEHRDDILDYLERNRIEVILPFLDRERQIIGLLALGSLRNNMIYSKSLISVLELYRIQLQQHLANSLMLEQVRATQVIEHDQMVVSAVKKKIIPQKISQTARCRVSSFYINNSTYGGDYFDSILLGEDRIVLFISDSSYSGVDSAIISLELYTVLHTPTKVLDTPDRILGTMNWVLSTSRFSSKHATAYCAIVSSNGDLSYSGAAFNPMMVYSPAGDTFTSCDAGGVPVGADRASKYAAKTMRLVPGTIGILYSDGLVSAMNDRGDVYGFTRVKEIIRSGKGKSPSDLAHLVFDDYTAFIAGRKQINDVSVIIFKYQ
ncbi:MAG TPA: SpoIIE family protein phosphatase [Spirochaetota bacterium]|nr:SpoIIE family protein phosphatase [Spirochaetota bacterium]HQF08476.1 SpoIIE family protein phosphatase [Spirochaetota bacterium]HQH97287.1 SpoIIE family protein phosphatase [Spirochaetota bacterium]HQJ70594.1 SpoIIE family protein phosphatase [Spirochaetota bacterium]HRT74151.1 SpoIIE family protein phosphatase [Spirochaetota bacterium]